MNQAARALVIFGAQGTGKGTQSKLLERHFDAVHIGMGDILREIAAQDTPEGRELKGVIDAGHLISDEKATQIIQGKLNELPAGKAFVMEGYPRTVQQSEDLRDMLQEKGMLEPRSAFIHLAVPEKELRARLEKRAELEGRADDVAESINQRLQNYENRTKPVLEAVTGWADVLEINGNQPIEKVTEEILKGLGHAS